MSPWKREDAQITVCEQHRCLSAKYLLTIFFLPFVFFPLSSGLSFGEESFPANDVQSQRRYPEVTTGGEENATNLRPPRRGKEWYSFQENSELIRAALKNRNDTSDRESPVTSDSLDLSQLQLRSRTRNNALPSATDQAVPLRPQPPEASLDPAPLEDILLEEGVISMDQWIRIKAAQEQLLLEAKETEAFTTSPQWYERLGLNGFAQFRYNQLGQPNGNLISWQDQSVGERLGEIPGVDPDVRGGFFLRRVRLILQGQVSDRVSIYFQPNFTTELDGDLNAVDLVDAWGQYFLDQKKEFRIRVGQQRVPCSFDMWQSSRVRVPLDRSDATATCIRSRDIGVSFQWTPTFAQHRWKHLADYLYGAGDFGMVNFTVYNGQGANRVELNADKFFAIRLAYPFELPGGRLFEVGMNANTGLFGVDLGTPQLTSVELFSLNEQKSFATTNYRDQRVNFYVYYPPQPWGFSAEYVNGRGPKRGTDGIVRERSLQGGYVMAQYLWKYSDVGLANFYGRWQTYKGGNKFLTGAPNVKSHATEVGIAWEPDPQWRITAAFEAVQRENFQKMADTATGTCSSTPTQSPPNPPLTNVNCNPAPQFEAYANLIRLQIQWSWN